MSTVADEPIRLSDLKRENEGGLKCPHCWCRDLRVVETRDDPMEPKLRRRRECRNCGHRFNTYERL